MLGTVVEKSAAVAVHKRMIDGMMDRRIFFFYFYLILRPRTVLIAARFRIQPLSFADISLRINSNETNYTNVF